MQTNEKLTEAARRGAAGHTASGAGVFSTLSPEKQNALFQSIISNKALTEEIVHSALLAMPRKEIEEMLDAMGEAVDDAVKAQQMHTGADIDPLGR